MTLLLPFFPYIAILLFGVAVFYVMCFPVMCFKSYALSVSFLSTYDNPVFCVSVSWFLMRAYLGQLHPGNLLVPLFS